MLGDILLVAAVGGLGLIMIVAAAMMSPIDAPIETHDRDPKGVNMIAS